MSLSIFARFLRCRQKNDKHSAHNSCLSLGAHEHPFKNSLHAFSYGFILFLSFLFTAFIRPSSGGDWKKEKEEDGIVVFSRTNEFSKIKELKAVAIFHSSLSVISAIILDIEKILTSEEKIVLEGTEETITSEN